MLNQIDTLPDSTTKKLRIVFAGTPHFAQAFLQLLLDTEHPIVGVYTQPDRRAGRGRKLQASPVKQLALEHNLDVYQPVNFKQQADRDQLSELKPDLMIVVAYGLILPLSVLDTPKYGCINVHASLLPRWRGAAPIQRAIEEGDAESGVTIMQMDVGLDSGDMLCIKNCPITSRDTAASLHEKLIETGKPALLKSLQELSTGSLQPIKQDDGLANYAHKIEKIEGLINWRLDAATLDRKIRAFYPFPVTYSNYENQRIKIHSAFILENHSQGRPGQIHQVSEQGIDVQTGSGTLRIETLQIPGKKAMSAADILRGYPDLFTTGKQFKPQGEQP